MKTFREMMETEMTDDLWRVSIPIIIIFAFVMGLWAGVFLG